MLSTTLSEQIQQLTSKAMVICYLCSLLTSQAAKNSNDKQKAIDFLKKAEPTFYIQALIIRNQPIDKKLLNSITKKMLKGMDRGKSVHLHLYK